MPGTRFLQKNRELQLHVYSRSSSLCTKYSLQHVMLFPSTEERDIMQVKVAAASERQGAGAAPTSEAAAPATQPEAQPAAAGQGCSCGRRQQQTDGDVRFGRL